MYGFPFPQAETVPLACREVLNIWQRQNLSLMLGGSLKKNYRFVQQQLMKSLPYSKKLETICFNYFSYDTQNDCSNCNKQT